MKALSLHQPWAWVVMEGIKRVENRRWPPYASMVGQRIAIHATARKFDPAGVDYITKQGLVIPPEANTFGAILGVATIDSFLELATPTSGPEPTQNVINSTEGFENQGRWFFGPYGWLLRDIIKIDNPIPCRGFQRLWNVAHDTELHLQVGVEVVLERRRAHGA